jgi:hypothetical protein
MAKEVGRVSLGLIGASFGWVFSGGNPLGAAFGFSMGYGLGQAAITDNLGTIKGPRLGDLSVQTAEIGAPIPIIYGRYPVSGNMIWSTELKETVKKKKQGGKGGPKQKVKTFSYSVTCAIGVCEGLADGIVRIWADTKLIYDDRDQFEDETAGAFANRTAANAAILLNMSIYLGSEDQLPDPTIEMSEGAGNVSAFRGLCYVVFNDFQVEEYGNRVPNFRFEVQRCIGLG